MIKIMFVCHGNICRSPMAEFIMKKLVSQQGLDSEFYISSSATSSEEIICGMGNEVYPPAKKELNKHNIDCSGKRAVKLKVSDYDKYDYLICMDEENIRNMNTLFNDNENKIFKLLDFAGIKRDVSDPWYTRNFEKTYDDIYLGCTALLDYLKNNKI